MALLLNLYFTKSKELDLDDKDLKILYIHILLPYDNFQNGKNWVLNNTKSYPHAKCILDNLLRRFCKTTNITRFDNILFFSG